MKKALILDPRIAGTSGDMFLASILDLTNDQKSLNELIEIINLKLSTKLSVHVEKVLKKGMNTTHLKIEIHDDLKSHHAIDLQESMEEILNHLDLSQEAKSKSIYLLNLLFKAESVVHNEPIEKLHLHETASVDTILDVVGTVFLLEKNDLLNVPILGLPVNTGSGFIKFSHGVVSVPPPAVLEILKDLDYPFFSDEIKGELLTPTGIILLGGLSTQIIDHFPPVKIKKIGYGAGNKELESRANVFRILSVELAEEESKNYLSMLETHLDDVSGELLGGIVNRLMNLDALDVSYYPLIMKKNRPGWCLRVICEEDQSSHLAKFIMKELGTLGVRENRFGRYELVRNITQKDITVLGKSYKCHFKERFIDGKIIGAKPEFDDISRLSEELEITFSELERIAINQYYSGEERDEKENS